MHIWNRSQGLENEDQANFFYIFLTTLNIYKYKMIHKIFIIKIYENFYNKK